MAETVTTTYDIDSSSSKHVIHHVSKYNKDYEMTNFANGTGMSIQLDATKRTNTPDFHGGSNRFETEQRSAKVTFTLVQNRTQDARFQAEYEELADKAEDGFTYYDTSNGERITMTDCVIESQPQVSMVNNVNTIQWVWLVGEYHRTFDEVSSIKDVID